MQRNQNTNKQHADAIMMRSNPRILKLQYTTWCNFPTCVGIITTPHDSMPLPVSEYSGSSPSPVLLCRHTWKRVDGHANAPHLFVAINFCFTQNPFTYCHLLKLYGRLATMNFQSKHAHIPTHGKKSMYIFARTAPLHPPRGAHKYQGSAKINISNSNFSVSKWRSRAEVIAAFEHDCRLLPLIRL